MENKNVNETTENTVVLTKKKKISKKHKAIIITASILVLLIAAYVVMNVIINAQKPSDSSGGQTETPELVEGEALYNKMAVAYPYIAKSKFISIAVRNHKDSYVISRPEADEAGKYEDYFMFFYEDDEGELQPYYPGICSEEDVDYTDFYAQATDESVGGPKIDYLCAAIGALTFDNRIPIDPDNRAAQLNRYGLNAEDSEMIYMTYIDEDGKQQEHRIYIGDKLITGYGFYFMVDGRDYIYASAASQRLEYLLGDFEDFLHSRIVAEGLKNDGIYEPYLTTDYKQWTNRYYGINNGGLGMNIAAGSEVIAYADVWTPVYVSATDFGGGYKKDGYTTMSIDLGYIAGRPEFSRLTSALLASQVGEYTDNEIVATVVTNINEVTLGTKYKYVIRGIEAVLGDACDFETEGFAVGDYSQVKVLYDYYLDGSQMNSKYCSAVINLDEDTVIPEDIKEQIRAAKIGDTLWLDFEVTYDENNSVKRNMEYVITDIVVITKIAEDGTISYPDVIEADSIVSYKYKYLVDGYEIGKEGSNTVDLSAITEGDNLTMKNAIIGKTLGKNLNLVVLNDVAYCQPFADFVTYRISTVKGFVQKDMVVSFEFVNSSERDPFYGESIYANTLGNENKYYALDYVACQNVTYFLGGLGSGSSTSQTSAGLVGSRTVAIGLTPANMDKYGLYDGYSVYFELPRGITGITGTDDYRYLSTLGFNLYISKTQSDGTRYVGSDMYDIIVQIDGAGFDYLEKSFEEYWARKNLVMLDYKKIENLTVDLGMTDVYGKYSFDLDHRTIYIVGNEHLDVKPETGGTEYDFITVTARPLSESMSDTAFKRILASENRDSMTLANLYNRVAGVPSGGVGLSVGHDTAGTSNFKELLRLLYNVNYTGVIAADEREAAFASPKIMSITFNISGSTYGYTYDFYRVSDRRVMVHLYRIDENGNMVSGSTDEVSGFYISTFAAKKIVNAFTTILNGEFINPDAPYWE